MGKATASVVEIVAKQYLINRTGTLPVNIHRRGILVTYGDMCCTGHVQVFTCTCTGHVHVLFTMFAC